MEYVKEQRERSREIKMLQVLKRALTLDARSKIKPTLKNPSLLRMSELRTGAGLYDEAVRSSMSHFRVPMVGGGLYDEAVRSSMSHFRVPMVGGGLTEDLEKSATLFKQAQEQRQIEFNKSLQDTIAKVNAASK
jgi:hypothetical protein